MREFGLRGPETQSLKEQFTSELMRNYALFGHHDHNTTPNGTKPSVEAMNPNSWGKLSPIRHEVLKFGMLGSEQKTHASTEEEQKLVNMTLKNVNDAAAEFTTNDDERSVERAASAYSDFLLTRISEISSKFSSDTNLGPKLNQMASTARDILEKDIQGNLGTRKQAIIGGHTIGSNQDKAVALYSLAKEMDVLLNQRSEQDTFVLIPSKK